MTNRTDWDSPSGLRRPGSLPADDEADAAWADPLGRFLPVTPTGDLAFDAEGPVWCPTSGPWRPDTDILLGRSGGAPRFARLLPDADAVLAAAGSSGAVTIGGLRAVVDDLATAVDLDVVFTALALTQWHAAASFCPRCGTATTMTQAGRTRRCPRCREDLFARNDPAMIVAVIGPDERLLLAHQRTWAPGRMSVLAGFVEAGESIEQAVHREVAEEVGLTGLSDLHYVGSQPWPFPRSLMLGYTVRSATTDLAVDGVEIVDARWFDRAGLTAALATGDITLPTSMSMAHRLIDAWWRGLSPEPRDATTAPRSPVLA